MLALASAGPLAAQENPPPDSIPAIPTVPAVPAIPVRPVTVVDSLVIYALPVAPAAAPEPAPTSALSSFTRPDRWKLAAEMSFTDQTGNKVLRLLTGGLKLSHREREIFELDGRVQSRYGKSEGEVVARNHYASLAVDLRPREVWSPSFFFDAERDEFKRLNLRFSGGAGAKYTLYENPSEKSDATLSLTLLYSHENLAASGQEAQQTRSVARWNLRAGGNQRVNDSLSLQHSSVYQPIWGEMADYLLRSETGAKVLLTERLALSVGYQINRTNRPPEGVQPEDRLFKTGFIIDF